MARERLKRTSAQFRNFSTNYTEWDRHSLVQKRRAHNRTRSSFESALLPKLYTPHADIGIERHIFRLDFFNLGQSR